MLGLGVIRLVQWLAVPRGGVLGLLSLAPGAVLAAVSLAVLALAQLHVHRYPEDAHAYAVALIASIVTVGATIEFFAGVFTFVWQSETIGRTNREPNLWTAERFVLWHLANAVPLIDAPRTMGWREPLVFSGTLTGVLLVAFKALLVVPVLRIAIATYGFVTRHALKKTPDDTDAHGFPMGTWPSTGALWGFALLTLALAAVAYISLPTGFASSSRAFNLLTDWTESGVDIAGEHVRLTWVPATLQLVAVCALLFFAWALFVVLRENADEPRPNALGIAGAIAVCVAFIALLTAIAAAALLALLHTGLGDTAPAIAPGEEVAEALTAAAWPIANSVPVLDIPGSFHWTARSRFVDYWSGAVLLTYKLLVILIVFVPLAHFVRLGTRNLDAPEAPDELSVHE